MMGWQKHVPILVGILTLTWGVVAAGRFPPGSSVAWVSWVVLMFHYQSRVNEILVQRAVEQREAVERVQQAFLPASVMCRYYAVLAAPLVVGVVDWLDVIPY